VQLSHCVAPRSVALCQARPNTPTVSFFLGNSRLSIRFRTRGPNYGDWRKQVCSRDLSNLDRTESPTARLRFGSGSPAAA
jgi:hypothetical protein